MPAPPEASRDEIGRELQEAASGSVNVAAEVARQNLLIQDLEEAVRSRDAVLSVVAHDLRNPLNIISLAAQSLVPKLPDAATCRLAERIIRSAQRADRMVRELLAVSAIETGKFALDTQSVETAELILGALESQHGLAAAASVIVAADVSPDLPPLQADADRLLDVLENLIGNAIKFTAQGGSITVGACSQGNEIRIWVKDSGAGIAAEHLPHIFDRFWQAQKKERRGVGLGLSICKTTVEAHGGRIWAESTIGAGTTMSFTVPMASASQPRVEAPEIANILLVDDRPENLMALEGVLERPGYHVVKARSGEEALALVARERFAVALVDIAMPGMNGLEVAVRLKELEHGRDMPIIFVTAFGDDPKEVHRAYAAGAADYLVKPLEAEIVRKKVAVFVDLSRRQWRNENLQTSSSK